MEDLSRSPRQPNTPFCPTELPRAYRDQCDLVYHAATAFSVACAMSASVGVGSLVPSMVVTPAEEVDNLEDDPSVTCSAAQDHDPSVPCRCPRRRSTWSTMQRPSSLWPV